MIGTLHQTHDRTHTDVSGPVPTARTYDRSSQMTSSPTVTRERLGSIRDEGRGRQMPQRLTRGALVHEWIAQNGGSENVLQEMSETFPDADVVCLWNDSTGRFDPSRLRESVLARTPLRRHKAAALPLMPMVWRTFRDREYDWALISSHAFAHHAVFRGASPDMRRMVYVHTPARYVWSRAFDARGNGIAARALSCALRPVDRRRAHEGAEFAANSEFVRRRIQETWGVDARVIHPPVQVSRIQSVQDWRSHLTTAERRLLDSLPSGFVLGASRFIPYKRLEEVIRVGELSGRPVVLAGRGPSLPVLQAAAAAARTPVHFVDAPSEAMLYALYQQTSLYVFPAIEDFGIMPVEAMAAGAPVLAQAEGGAAESVVPGRTGALVSFTDPDEIREGVEKALTTHRSSRVAHAVRFSSERFRKQIVEWTG